MECLVSIFSSHSLVLHRNVTAVLGMMTGGAGGGGDGDEWSK